MTGNNDHRLVSHETPDGTRYIAVTRRTPETDQLSDDQIITDLQQWKAQHQPAPAGRKQWPMPPSYDDWLTTTKPGPQEPCPACECWSLRTCPDQDNPGRDTVVCTMLECEASPFYRA